MRITINAFGSRGDVQPYVALGLGLKEAGHEVTLTTHRIFEGFVREYDLGFYPLEIDPRQVLVSQNVAEVGGNPFQFTRWLKKHFQPIMDDVFRVTLESAREADLLLNSMLCFAGWHVAQKLGIPAVAAYLQPAIPTSAFHCTSAAPPASWLPFKGAYNYASTKLANQLFFYMLLPLVNASRAHVLDLPPLKASYYWRIDSPDAKAPLLFGFSPSLIPRPDNWGPYQQVSGYWFLEGAQGYQPPAVLGEFLASGPPPVYVGIGSMVDHERDEMTRLVVAALEQAGQRAILLGGWSELGSAELPGSTGLPDSILRVDFVPHDWLFPRMAAVVHHGGAGTTHTGLRAGVPTVVVPFFGDQPFWGWRVHELGAGPQFIHRKKLSAENLAAAIEQAVSDEDIRRRAAALGESIRAEDGVGNAVKLVEHFAELPVEW